MMYVMMIKVGGEYTSMILKRIINITTHIDTQEKDSMNANH